MLRDDGKLKPRIGNVLSPRALRMDLQRKHVPGKVKKKRASGLREEPRVGCGPHDMCGGGEAQSSNNLLVLICLRWLVAVCGVLLTLCIGALYAKQSIGQVSHSNLNKLRQIKCSGFAAINFFAKKKGPS